ncbi:hypothetical protein H072_8936 [Dactylellina haptotyla CBS 200.50]|uniref:Squalene/phytoene synthase n=1 Tax=Dactylellina haptotyla (strain CBS 200.50) TaxID=1284197 RepID=S8A3R6_DACHA|nr:hypothetical protein H072_8936 [Dactylellina haptotyla CBS 200.50]
MSSLRALRRVRPIGSLTGVRRHSTHAHSHSHSHSHDAPTNIEAVRNYCQELLRTHDYPSYILSTFTPQSIRDAHLAIRAFNVDVARVADQVSNLTVGRMRMQFWRDAIENTYSGHPPQEPVALLLAKVIHQDGIQFTKSFWMKLIAAREQYLGNQSYANIDALESYSESTYSSLHYLSLEALNYRSTNLDHVASHIGKASGITAVLRGTPLLAAPGPNSTHAAVLLPVDVCVKHGLRQEDVIRYGGSAEGLKDVIFEIATRANDHLITAREMLKHAGNEGKGLAFATFLPAVPTALYLGRLEKADFDVFDASLQRREWRLPWKAYIANTQRQF